MDWTRIFAWLGPGLVFLPLTVAAAMQPHNPTDAQQEARRLANLPALTVVGTRPDHSGRRQSGHASYYARHFRNRKMANGNRFNPNAAIAASKTLPLGTTAKVTNLQNGRSVTVQIEDRGPFGRGRVVDVTPKLAEQLHIGKQGIVPVIVAPIAVPQVDGTVKLGAGAADATATEIAKATRETTEAAAR